MGPLRITARELTESARTPVARDKGSTGEVCQRPQVKDSPRYDASKTVDWAYENHYHNHYGDIRPSDMF